jgi:hypothetical protein
MANKKYRTLYQGSLSNEQNFTTPFENSRKYPFVCNDTGNLFKISEITDPKQRAYGSFNPKWLDIVVNSQTDCFISDYARNILGPILCQNLAKIPSCQQPVQGNGNEKISC